jgi:hypothetical protein
MAVQNTMVKRTREAKIQAGSASLAMKMAKDNDDILYRKAQRFKKLFVNAKKAVMTKYGQRARTAYLKKMGSSQTDKKTTKK